MDAATYLMNEKITDNRLFWSKRYFFLSERRDRVFVFLESLRNTIYLGTEKVQYSKKTKVNGDTGSRARLKYMLNFIKIFLMSVTFKLCLLFKNNFGYLFKQHLIHIVLLCRCIWHTTAQIKAKVRSFVLCALNWEGDPLSEVPDEGSHKKLFTINIVSELNGTSKTLVINTSWIDF